MIHPTVLYLILSLVLLIIAVVVHVRSSNLSLAISPAVSIITIILPIVGFLNTACYPTFRRNTKSSPNGIAQLGPLVVQFLQALIATILATLLLERAVPSSVTSCMLDKQWMGMFRAHDAGSIRKIQDAFDCCGLNSVRDRAYPFPGTAPSNCAETYRRRTACREPWQGALQTMALLDFAVVVGVGLVQILGLFLSKDGSNWRSTWGFSRSAERSQNRESRRPLLIDRERDVVEEEEAAPERPERESQGYGSMRGDESGPRVVPSSVVERNNWADE
ncbi:hypothetical protein NW752_012245 [Fusarium irregulare]|uniref:Tetraspanin n=1 Tax=Fusarium irregulare TaxID=2494466 RepID=A0A9W8U5M0_9HYPO|nr:hypothetical protein NW752_012245 [Fusarium irregulare]KAJ4004299.1 hypothetical protein NW766_011603 [Fusarium irregulare]